MMSAAQRVVLIVVLGVLLAALPAGAHGAGFGAPRIVTPAGGTVDSPQVVVAPTGRTAVFFRWIARRGRQVSIHDRVKLGPDPDHLGAAQDVPGGQEGQVLQAAASPDGTITACISDEPRGSGAKAYTLTCSQASPGAGRFGVPQQVASLPPTTGGYQPPSFSLLALADGRLALFQAQYPDGRHAAVSVAFAPPGTLAFGPARPLGDAASGAVEGLPDGGIIAARSTAGPVVGEPGRGLVSLLAPGAEAFGAAAPFTDDDQVAAVEGLTASRHGTAIVYSRSERRGPPTDRVVVRRPDGSWAPPVPLPTPGTGFVGGRVVFLPDGEPLVVDHVFRESSTDCSNQTSGRVAAGPLSAAHPTLLSNPRQIANLVDAVALDDGTVVAVWVDEADKARIEYAIRPAGGQAFARARPLPVTSARDVELGGDGAHLIAVWTTGSLPEGPSRLVIATLRRSPPYAPAAKRPRHPSTPCA